MNFDDTPEEAAYRKQVATWLDCNAIPVPETRRRRDATPEWLALAKAWQRTKADAGYVGIAWPTSWGGQGGTVAQQLIFDAEEASRGLHFTFFEIGLGLCVPTVASFANHATIDRISAPARRGEEIWCQLFSEPGVGSDLAAVQTRAVKDGERWVVNGQKVWTSGAQYSDFAILLTRTDPHVPKHRGLTMFWVDLRAAGIEVRPLRQMSGVANFNEVFLTDVNIPDSQRLGPVNAGWTTTMTTLMNERVSIGDVGGADVRSAMDLARATPCAAGCALDDPVTRMKLAERYIEAEGVRLTRNRLLTANSRGERPGPENAILKLVAANAMQELARDALLARGPMGIVVERGDDAVEGIFADSLTWSPGYRIAGGTDEILRTVIGERVLGLPAEPRADKDKPFAARKDPQ